MPQPKPVGRSRVRATELRRSPLLAFLALLIVLLVGAAPAAASSETAFTITGRGWGHGIGMSQWGAYGLAKHGSTYKQILRHYYTGIGFTSIDSPVIRVRLRSGLSAVGLTCTSDYAVRGSSSEFTIPAGTKATVKYVDGRYHVAAGSWSQDFTTGVTFKPSKGSLNLLTATDLGTPGRYRGEIRVVRSGSYLMVVNLLPLESYLRGVVPREVSPAWPKEALKAQACAARSYAERARRGGRDAWDVYCDVRSQAYGGVAWEDPRSDAAIAATAGIVPSYKGAPIQAFYFACSGGQTENIELAWETSPMPYLKARDDPYDRYAPRHTWGPIRQTPSRLAAGLGSAVEGTLRAIYTVQRGQSPRIVKAAIIGSSGTTYIHGSALRMKLGLNSAWATFTSMSIAPAARDGLSVAPGAPVTLKGTIYPALAADATVKLAYSRQGAWRTLSVATMRHTQTLPDGQSAKYSTYQVVVNPEQTTKYYFASGTAKSPTTTITVQR